MKNPARLPLILFCLLAAGCNLPQQAASVEGAATPTPRQAAPTATTVPTRTPSATPFDPQVEITGDEELVYDWSENPCSPNARPDLPVRAFRNADGLIQLNLSHEINYRLIGPDLDNLALDCTPILTSALNPDPAAYRFKQWIGATYTLDGQTVYAIVHNEFHGDLASRWQFNRDFGNEQGANGWQYLGVNGGAYYEMTFDQPNDRWQGNRALCQISAWGVHPDTGCDPSLAWTSSFNGTALVAGHVQDADPSGGNGVYVSLIKNDTELWAVVLENGDTDGQSFEQTVDVAEGDVLYLRVNARGDAGWDATAVNLTINPGEEPCPSGNPGLCLMMNLTYAVSTDGGASFTQPDTPDNLVANLPLPYLPDGGHYAIWQPSNIVQHPEDGYFYTLIQLDRHTAGGEHLQGMCVMRTQTLNDPKSWRAWDGTGFDMPFADPYTNPSLDPADHTCEVVSLDQAGALTYNLTYNDFLGKFIAVGHWVHGSPPGIYYSLSDNLVNWTPRRLLMPAQFIQNTNGATPYLAYPALVDPDSPSMSFDITGQTPFLYFTRVNSMNPLDFDLWRVRIRFDK